MMNKKEITIGFKDQTGFRVSKCDITTGKVVVNGIEITSVEDWEKVTNSLIDLQQKLDNILTYAKKQCDDYLKEDDCEYCDGVFASCRKILQLAGEDIRKYE